MRRALLTWLLLAVGTGCGVPPEGSVDADARWHVVARYAGPGQPVTLARHARRAVRGRFEIESPVAVERLTFSLGVNGGEPAEGSAHFRVEAWRGGHWQDVFQETLPSGSTAPAQWHDRRVELGGVLRGATRFRFTARLDADTPDARRRAWFGSPALLARGPATRPNVVFLLLDTLGASYLGRSGEFPGVSPAIDAFLAESFAFDRSYAQYGSTLTSTASLLTGLYPIHHGVYADVWSAQADFDSLVPELSRAGYLTAAITEGGYVASGWGTSAGFDHFDDGPFQEGRAPGFAPRTFREATRWLRENGPDHRFFLLVHTYEVHSPYLPRTQASRAIIEQVSPADARPLGPHQQALAILGHNRGRDLLSDRNLLRLKAHHLATVHGLDQHVASFLETLDALDLADDTLVVLLADHGDQFGEQGKVGHGETLHNRVLHVPLGFRWVGRITPGSSAAPVQLVDVLPTVLDLLELALPPGLDGRSLAPLITGTVDASAHGVAFSELRGANSECERLGLEPDCRLDRFAVQTGRFKLVTSRIPPGEAFYDLDADPLESADVSRDHPEELERHRALLAAYLADRPDTEGSGAPDAPLDPALRKRLEALGYLE